MKKNISIIAMIFAFIYLFVGLVALCFDSEFSLKLSAYIIVIDGLCVVGYFLIKWVIELTRLYKRNKFSKKESGCDYF